MCVVIELPVEWVWPLEILEKCPKVRPSIEDVALPGNLQAMRDKGTEETQQVHFLCEIKLTLVIYSCK